MQLERRNYSNKKLLENKRERSCSGNFTSKHLHRSLLFNKVTTANLLKRDFLTVTFLWIWGSPRWCFLEKGVLKNFAKCTGKHLCWSFFKYSCRRLTQAFSYDFAKFLRTPFLRNTSGWLENYGKFGTQLFYRTLLNNCFCAPQVFIEIFRNCLKRFESKKSLLHLKTHYSCFYFRILSFRNCKTWWEISTVFCFIEINILYIFNWNLSLVTHMHKLYFKN